jgi:hypothetical protein
MNSLPEILSDENGRNVERAAVGCNLSDHSTNNLFPSDSGLVKKQKLPNEPISDFTLLTIHQSLIPIYDNTNPKNEPNLHPFLTLASLPLCQPIPTLAGGIPGSKT